MTRRSVLGMAMAAPFTRASMGDSPLKMGVATTSYLSVWRPKDALEFLGHCQAMGAAGVQVALNGDLRKIRAQAERYGMYVEAMVSLPKDSDTTAFEQSLRDAQTAGAVALRAGYLSGRRYETFTSLADWQAYRKKATAAIEASLPLLERYKIPLGLENHKDWTADEMSALMKKYSNEYLGVCLDFGNNISLLDDPMDVVEKLAPYTVTTHLKDMGVEAASNGFLLSEVLLGQGLLDLPKIIARVKQARPATRFSLEMITRDPLLVPCLTDNYWATFPDRSGLYLARTLNIVRKQSQAGKPLPRISQLPRAEQLKLEDDNVKACLGYARDKLNA